MIGGLSDGPLVSTDRIDCFGRRSRVLTAKDPTTLEVQSGDYYEDVAAERRLACLQTTQARTSKALEPRRCIMRFECEERCAHGTYRRF